MGGLKRAVALSCTLPVLALFAVSAVAADAKITSMTTTATRIEAFRVGHDDQTFGPLRFIGGLSLVADSRDFGALSSIRFLDAGERFHAVADTGFFVRGRVVRDAQGKPVNFADVSFEELRDKDGGFSNRKWEVDAESLDVEGDTVTIGFERDHRIVASTLGPDGLSHNGRNLDFLIPPAELRSNRGFETLAHAPVESALAGATVVISEKSIDTDGNIFAAVLDGPRKGIFKVVRRDDFDITDGDFLPDGDLLILERSYRISDGVKMRIRRISGDAIAGGAVVDGEALLVADLGYQIDNMEGLDVFRAPDGGLRVALISDDNKSILQRNLYLEFELTGE